MKKPTAKDVAREAGVSVATVSYVFNNRSEMKISEQTKKKVLQIANLLQYIPSYAAKSLATGKSHIIGIQPGQKISDILLQADNIELINILGRLLNQKGYDIMILPEINRDTFLAKQNLDAIITFDLSAGDFDFLSNNYLIPIVNVDMVIGLYLFFEIQYDFEKIHALINEIEPDCTLVMKKPENEKMRDYIISCIGKNRVQFISDAREISGIAQNSAGSLAFLGEYPAACAAAYMPASKIIAVCQQKDKIFLPKECRILELNVKQKAEKIIESLFNAMQRIPDIEHRIKI